MRAKLVQSELVETGVLSWFIDLWNDGAMDVFVNPVLGGLTFRRYKFWPNTKISDELPHSVRLVAYKVRDCNRAVLQLHRSYRLGTFFAVKNNTDFWRFKVTRDLKR